MWCGGTAGNTDVFAARGRVDVAKRGLGERGPPWWTDGTPDYDRRVVKNTPFAKWFAGIVGKDAVSS